MWFIQSLSHCQFSCCRLVYLDVVAKKKKESEIDFDTSTICDGYEDTCGSACFVIGHIFMMQLHVLLHTCSTLFPWFERQEMVLHLVWDAACSCSFWSIFLLYIMFRDLLLPEADPCIIFRDTVVTFMYTVHTIFP